MGLARYKKEPEGFRQYVELLESTPSDRRQKLIDVGMEEDAEFTKLAVKYMMEFADLLKISDMEIAEIVGAAPPRMVGFALQQTNKEIQDRYLRCAKGAAAGEIRDALEDPKPVRDINGARMVLLKAARKLEKEGYLSVKKIPQKVQIPKKED